ncbi:hypothetical protein ACES2J_17275 [Bdellovibrio bacteriovorus]|uniref:hypothetical protein n=1 Tax=Bdellovibrio bacteriovorus TaxID=959 RepID=UPI0035A61C9E
MNKKLFSTTLSAMMILSACAPQKETVREIIRTQGDNQDDQGKAESSAAFFPFWEQMAAGAQPNPALARLLVPYLNSAQRESYLRSYPADSNVLTAFEKDRQMAKSIYMLQTLGFKNDPAVLSYTVNYRYNQMSFSAKGIHDDFNLTLQIQRQNEAMQSLLKTYSDRAQKVAQELAPHYIQQLSPEDQKKLAQAARSPRAEAIEKTVEILKNYDKILSAYNFHDDDNTKLVVIGLVAGAVVDQLVKNPSVQDFIRKAREVIDVAAKVREAASLVQVIHDNRKQMNQDLQAARGALEGLGNDIKKGRWDLEFRPETRVETLRLMNDALTGNLQTGSGNGPLSEPQSINKNVEIFVSSAASAAGRLDNILNATEKIAVTLGVNLDPGIRKAIDTARTVTSAINIGQAVMKAYSSGGLISAMSMMAGGPGPALLGAALGGGGLDAQMAADMKEIKRDLAEIKRMQKQMLEMQMETMVMIRDLAVMVESYHVQQMAELRSIKSLVVQQIESQRILLHTEIAACEKMVQFGVSLNGDTTKSYRLGSVATGDVTKELLKNALKNKGSLVEFVRSAGESTFETCQKSMTRAFGRAEALENPIQLVASQKADELANFYEDMYAPLWEALKDQDIIRYPVYSMGLHLPAANVEALVRKVDYANRSERPAFDAGNYDLKNLISTEGLERYVESLLVLHPILSYDKADWLALKGDPSVLKERYNISWNRSQYWLKNALALVNSAIAQEALMVGEPLLPGLADRWGKITGKTDCSKHDDPTQGLLCTIRRNSMFSKNLLKFVIRQRIPVEGLRTHYATALAAKNIQALEFTLGLDFHGKLQVKDVKDAAGNVKEQYVVLSWQDKNGVYETRMPSAEEVTAGEIEYTGNMKRLMVLQDKVVEAYLEVTPMAVDESVQKQVRRLTLQK